jgi:hypothetical protein
LSKILTALSQTIPAKHSKPVRTRIPLKVGAFVAILLTLLALVLLLVWFPPRMAHGATSAITQILQWRLAIADTSASHPRLSITIVLLSLIALCLGVALLVVCLLASRRSSERGSFGMAQSSHSMDSLDIWQRRIDKFTRRWPAFAVGTVLSILLVVCFWFASQFQDDLVPFAAAIIVCGIGLLLIKKLWQWLTGIGVSDVIKNDVPTVIDSVILRWTRSLSATERAAAEQSIRDICAILANAYSMTSQARLIRVALGSVVAVGGAFLVYVQIQKLTEQNRLFETQNRLFETQNAIGVSVSHFEMDLALGKDNYDDLSKQLADPEATDVGLAAALRKAPDIAVRPVRVLARDERSVLAKSPLQLDYRYPHYDPIRGLLRTFIQSDRLGRKTKSLNEKRLRAEATTELVIALHETQLEPVDATGEPDETLKEQLLSGKISQELGQRLERLSSSDALSHNGASMNRPPPNWKALFADAFRPPEIVVLAGWPSDLFHRAQLPFVFRLTKEKPIILLPPDCDAPEADFSQWNAIFVVATRDGSTMANFRRTSFECADVGFIQPGPGKMDLSECRFGGGGEVTFTSVAGAEISNASFGGAELVSNTLETSFKNTTFVGARIRGHFLSCNLRSTSLVGARVSGGQFFDCNFADAQMAGANFQGSKAAACNFSRANFAPTTIRVREKTSEVLEPRGSGEEGRVWYEPSQNKEGINIQVPGAVLYMDVKEPLARIVTNPDFVRDTLDQINQKGTDAVPELKTFAADSLEFTGLWQQLMNNRPEAGFGLDRMNGIKLAIPKSLSQTALFKDAPHGGMPSRKKGYTLEHNQFAGAVFANKRGACYMPTAVRDSIRTILNDDIAQTEEELKKGPIDEGFDEMETEEDFKGRLQEWLTAAKETRSQLDRVITDEVIIEKQMKWNVRDAVLEAKKKSARSLR